MKKVGSRFLVPGSPVRVLAAASCVALATSLFAQGPPPAWQDTIRNLRHPDARVRLEAVQSLGQAGFTPAADAVAPLLTDRDDLVQAAAIDAELTFFLTESIGGRRVLSLSGSTRSRAQEAFEAGPTVRAAASAPPVVIDQLIAAIRDDNARIRFDAVHALGVIAEPPLTATQVQGLIDQLDHYEPVIRTAAARVIGRLKIKQAGDKLIAAMNDSSGIVRQFSIDALGQIREPRALASLLQFFSHYNKGDEAAWTFLAIARIGDPSTREVLRGRLTDKNAGIRRAAVEGLGRIGDRESLPTVKQLAETDRDVPVRIAAMFAIDQFGEPQSHLLASELASKDNFAQARDYLLEIGAAAVPGVESALSVATDGRARADLVRLIGFIGKREQIALVEPLLKDKDERVQRAAADALARLNR